MSRWLLDRKRKVKFLMIALWIQLPICLVRILDAYQRRDTLDNIDVLDPQVLIASLAPIYMPIQIYFIFLCRSLI